MVPCMGCRNEVASRHCTAGQHPRCACVPAALTAGTPWSSQQAHRGVAVLGVRVVAKARTCSSGAPRMFASHLLNCPCPAAKWAPYWAVQGSPQKPAGSLTVRRHHHLHIRPLDALEVRQNCGHAARQRVCTCRGHTTRAQNGSGAHSSNHRHERNPPPRLPLLPLTHTGHDWAPGALPRRGWLRPSGTRASPHQPESCHTASARGR